MTSTIGSNEVWSVPWTGWAGCPGAGHGGLSRKLLEMHPTANTTVSDLDSTSVTNIAAGDLGRHPRATIATMDATAIDAPAGSCRLLPCSRLRTTDSSARCAPTVRALARYADPAIDVRHRGR